METTERHLFSKSERLFLKKDIDCLFAKGKALMAYPLRVIYTVDSCLLRDDDVNETACASGISILISVAKKHIKKAVKRNRIKRLIREAFRLNKQKANDFVRSGKRLRIVFIYVCNEPLTYPEIEKAIIKALYTIIGNETANN